MSTTPSLFRRLLAASLLIGSLLTLAPGAPFSAQGKKATPKSSIRHSSTIASKNKKVNTDSKENTFATPDFAFPRDVENNAQTELEKAITSGDEAQAVRAAIQLTIASNTIDRDSVGSCLELLDSLAAASKAPYSNMLYLLEAKLYSEVFDSNRWQYNQRNLPLDSYPEDVYAWSGDLFRRRIYTLVQAASKDFQTLLGVPISEVYPLLTQDGSKLLEVGYPTVGDFVAREASDLLAGFTAASVIPFAPGGGKRDFNSEVAGFLNGLDDECISAHRSQGDRQAEMTALLRKSGRQPSWEQQKMLLSAVDAFSGHPASIRLVDPIYNNNLFGLAETTEGDEEEADESSKIPDYIKEMHHGKLITDRRAFFDYASEELRQFPDTIGSNRAFNILNDMQRKTVKVSGMEQYTSRDSVVLTIDMNNVENVYMLILRLKEKPDGSQRLEKLLQGAELVKACPLNVKDSVPFATRRTVNAGRLPYGCYIAVPSAGATVTGISKQTRKEYADRLFLVSDLCVVGSYGNSQGESSRLYVVSAFNQEPVKGARLTMTGYGSRGKTTEAVSNSEGWVEVPDGSYKVIVAKGSDKVYLSAYSYQEKREKPRTSYRSNLYTDLAIYKPGQTVGFSGIYYSTYERRSKVLAGEKVFVAMLNANSDTVATRELVTDSYGRVSGEFQLPDDGLLGSYTLISAPVAHQDNQTYKSFQVAEYKAPTFEVVVDKVGGSYKVGDRVKISGRATTYSGMPVAGAEVKYNVKFRPRWWWFMSSNPDASYAGTATTDGEGVFAIELDTEGLRDTPFCNGAYELFVSATDAAGETQEASAVSFSLGSAYAIQANVPQSINVEEAPKSFRVEVVDMVGAPVEKKVEYRVTNMSDGKVVGSGTFTSPSMPLDVRSLDYGNYRLSLTVEGDPQSRVRKDFVLWSDNSKEVPYATPLWVPRTKITAKKGDKDVKVKLGSSYPDSYLLCMAYDTDRLLWRKWVRTDGRMTEVSVPVAADNQRVKLKVSGIHSLKSGYEEVTVSPYESTAGIEIVKETFRDKLVPGDKETWKFRFKPKGAAAEQEVAALAVMSNKALNAITPFNWGTPGTWFNYDGNSQLQIWSVGTNADSFQLSNINNKKVNSLPVPSIYTYGSSLYGNFISHHYYLSTSVRGVKMKSNMRMADMTDEVKMEEEMAYDAVPEPMLAESAVQLTEAPAGGRDGGVSGSSVQPAEKMTLRDIECPLAFFRPNLLSKPDGELELSFQVPDFNTTWALQLLGYTPDLLSALGTYESVASKAVMVQTNAPRFLRTGDETVLRATVFNNTEAEAPIDVVMEVFNPLTDEVLRTSRYEGVNIASKASQVFSTDFTAPDDITCVGLRVYATCGNHRDGEQTIISLLPSSSPVIESTPFYLGPTQNDFALRLPEMKKNSTVTLQYCDNPAWVCLTALPDITGKPDASITSKITTLYGTAIANGLVKKMPQARQAIADWLANPSDSVLISPLMKNEELKNVALNNTPWVQNARSESLRMLRLGHLLDTKRNDVTISRLLDDIIALQNGDGGFAWCPGMKSSDWATGRVLLYTGMLKGLGYLPASSKLDNALRKGIGYCDKELLRYVAECRDYYPLSYALNYYYVRSFFDEPMSAAVKKDLAKCLADLKKDWRSLGIYDVSTAAILLSRQGDKSTASQILESLSQRATRTEGKGIWFANVASGFTGFSKLITTTQALEAFAEIAPESPEVDGIRQWLIMQKQAQEWGDNPYTAEIVNAVLRCGSDWTVASEPAQIFIGGKPVEVDKRSHLIGQLTVDIPAEAASGAELRIVKGGEHPAWGGVVSRYIQPMADVKAASTEDISITKEIYKVDDTTQGTFVSDGDLTQGQRVRVTLTLTSTRDLDYVDITDERAACMEPTDQLSAYTSTDGLFYYREVGDSATNLFIGFLPKGTWQITYDCFIDRTGDYSCGIATAQSLYAPTIVAHSGGRVIATYASAAK